MTSESSPETFRDFLAAYRKNPSLLSTLEDQTLIDLFEHHPEDFSFEFASDKQKNNAELVLQIYEKNPDSIKYASDAVVFALFEENKIDTSFLSTAQFNMIMQVIDRVRDEQHEIKTVLGILFGGWNVKDAVRSTCTRYQQLSNDSDPLPYHGLPINSAEFFTDVLASQEHGAYQGIQGSWENHAFSVHALREGDTVHFIYVNRGRRAFETTECVEGTVHVFSCPHDQASAFAKDFHAALITKQRDCISAFLAKQIDTSLYNKAMSSHLAKSNQKTDNCSTANANIAWHFNLASHAMKADSILGFSDAYTQTKPVYKGLRIDDRCRLFCNFMQTKDRVQNLFSEEIKEMLSEILSKFHSKNNPAMIKQALSKLAHDAPALLFDLLQGIQDLKKDPNMLEICHEWEQEIKLVTASLKAEAQTSAEQRYSFFPSASTTSNRPTQADKRTSTKADDIALSHPHPAGRKLSSKD